MATKRSECEEGFYFGLLKRGKVKLSKVCACACARVCALGGILGISASCRCVCFGGAWTCLSAQQFSIKTGAGQTRDEFTSRALPRASASITLATNSVPCATAVVNIL